MEGRRTSASTLNADPPQVIKMNEKMKKNICEVHLKCHAEGKNNKEFYVDGAAMFARWYLESVIE